MAAKDDIAISVQGAKALHGTFGHLHKSIDLLTRESLARGLEPVRDRAKELVPVDTGRLRDSIKIVVDPARTPGKVSARVETGTLEELGKPILTERGLIGRGLQLGETRFYYPAFIESKQSYLRRAFDQHAEQQKWTAKRWLGPGITNASIGEFFRINSIQPFGVEIVEETTLAPYGWQVVFRRVRNLYTDPRSVSKANRG